MMAASIWRNLFGWVLRFALFCTIGFVLMGTGKVHATEGATSAYGASEQMATDERVAQNAPTAQAMAHTIFMPLIATPGGVQLPIGGARLSQSPQIDRFIETLDDGDTSVTFDVTNNTGHEIRRLAVEYVLSVEAGSVADLVLSTDAPNIFSKEKQTDGGEVSCRFSVAPASALAPNAEAKVGCRYSESAAAIVTSETTLRPRPYNSYDRNYDQIGDRLARAISERSASGESANDLLPVLVLLNRRPLAEDYARFQQAGGVVTYRSAQLTIFGGDMPARAIGAYAADIADHLEMIGDNLPLDSPPFTSDIVSRDATVAEIPQVVVGDPIDEDRYMAIGILDTGLDGTHTGLRDKITGWHDVLSADNRQAIDPVGHGSHVAGIAAGQGGNFRGVAVDTPLVGIRQGSIDNWRVLHFVKAIDWAVDNRQRLDIAVLNNSNVYTEASISQNPFWAAAATQAVEAGIVFVNAAGDGYGDSLQGDATGSPATEPKVLTVGAVNGSNEITYFSSRGSPDAPDSAHTKPDIVAPGSNVLSLLSNQTSAASEENQFSVKSGTSMAAPYVAGQAALLAGQMFDAINADEDADDLSGEDGWDGIDNDGDGLIDEDAGPWDFSERAARTVKSLVLMAAAEVGGGEVVPDGYPNANAANDPRSRWDAPPGGGYDRGGKDSVEGYGAVDIRAALEAATQEFCAYGAGTLGSLPTERRVWVRHLHLNAGKEYALVLDGPDDADYDLFLYQGFSNAYGEPLLAREPGQAGRPIVGTTPDSADEALNFSVRADGLYYLVVRRVQGEGDFTVHLTTPSTWTIMLYMPAELAGPANLDAEAFELLNELESVGAGQEKMREVQVLAFVDYDARNRQDDNRLHATAGFSGDALLYCVRKDHRDGVSQYSVPLQPSELVRATVDADQIMGTEANMGAPETLERFAAFAVDHFPAAHYGLILWGDRKGYGWKTNADLALGPGNDTRRNPDKALDSQADAFDLVELGDALAEIKTKIGRGSDFLAGTGKPGNLDLLGFDMGQMAQIEVAAQVQPFVDILVAPETNASQRWPYAEMLRQLACRADGDGWNCNAVGSINAEELARAVVQGFVTAGSSQSSTAVLSALRLNGAGSGGDPCATFTSLIGCLDELTIGLATGVDRAVTRDDNQDNTQVLLSEQVREAVAELHDRNAVDLRDFVGLLSTAGIDGRYRPNDRDILNALSENGDIVFALGKTGAAENLHGLSIYFPKGQLQPDDNCTEMPGDDPFSCGYANPLPSHKLYAADEHLTLPSLADENHPRPALTDFRFVLETGWGAFLNRYYKPVAQACLLSADECVRRLSLQIGEKVVLSGLGSSDIDGQPQDHAVSAWYWDVDPLRDDAGKLPSYSSGDQSPIDTPCSEDCDRDGVDEDDDDPDKTGPTITWRCPAYGSYKIRLIVHDDHHLQPPLQDEDVHNRHWNVDDDTIIATCFESPYQRLTPNPVVSTRPFAYRLVARGNGALDDTAPGSIIVAMPAYVSIDPETFDCPGDGCSLDSRNNTISWSGIMVADGEVQIEFAAMVQSDAIPDDAPYLTSEAEIYDGLINSQMTTTTPVIVKRAEPAVVAPGSTVTYLTVIPVSAELTELAKPDFYDYFPDVDLAAHLTYDSTIEFPKDSQPPKDELISGQISWKGTVEPGEVIAVRYAIRVSETLPVEFCGATLATNGQVSDGSEISNNVNTAVQIVCPDQ